MNHTNNTLIPERLKSARERLNLSKAEAARRIGLTAASYVRYEAGDRRPSPQVIISIAEKMNTSVAYLSGETDDISPDVINIHKNSDPILKVFSFTFSFHWINKFRFSIYTDLNMFLCIPYPLKERCDLNMARLLQIDVKNPPD